MYLWAYAAMQLWIASTKQSDASDDAAKGGNGAPAISFRGAKTKKIIFESTPFKQVPVHLRVAFCFY
jgi:hypothetical protein